MKVSTGFIYFNTLILSNFSNFVGIIKKEKADSMSAFSFQKLTLPVFTA